MGDRGEDWVEKGEKKLKSFSLFSGGQKFEEAADYFAKGANQFKVQKKWDQAGSAYCKAAECFLKVQSKHEAATNYVNAASCYKKSNVPDAVKCLRDAVELFTDEGRFAIAAKHQQEIGQLYESENDMENAVDAYKAAADFFDGEGSTSSANTCLLKVAQFSAQLEKYDKAIELFEQVARNSLDNNLLKWSVKEYFLKAGLCHLCTADIVSAKRAVDKYKEMDPTFSSQRECKFLEQLVEAYENFDAEAYTAAVVEFDSITKLDPWKTTILLRIKNSINSESSGLK